MKEYKMQIFAKLNEEARNLNETHRTISFYEICKSLGYEHISAEDTREIADKFLNENPNVSAFWNIEKVSLFCGLVFTKARRIQKIKGELAI